MATRRSRGPDSIGFERHRRTLEELESIAARAKGLESRAVWSGLAAEYAWRNHTGCYTSPRLEALLSEVGQMLPAPSRQHAPVTPPKNVLHVMTAAGVIGGHSRLVYRWMDSDPERRHSLALTSQGKHPVPKPLRRAVDRSNGRVTRLDQWRDAAVGRACDLRELAAGYDCVVLHVHQHDVIPLMAFAETHTPVALMNHADHTFWLGTTIADVVVDLRCAGAAFSRRRRGIPENRSLVLPIPVTPLEAGLDKRAARELLGVGAHSVLLLTVASPYKYATDAGSSLPDAITPVLRDHPEALLLAVGPAHDGPWARAYAATGGRVRALGLRPDVAVLYSAADLYIDSFPLTSLTSILDAAQRGLPALARRMARSELFQPTDLGLGDGVVVATDLDDYRRRLSRLVTTQALRLELGAQAQAGVLAGHTGPQWSRALERVYDRAAERLARRSRGAFPVECEAHDVELLQLHAASGVDTAFALQVPRHLRLLPPAERPRALVRVGLALRGDWTRLIMRAAQAVLSKSRAIQPKQP